MQFHEKNFFLIYLISRVFLPGLFSKTKNFFCKKKRSKTLLHPKIPGRKCAPPPAPRGIEDLRRLPKRLEATEALEAVAGGVAAGGAPGAVILPGVMSPHD